MKALRHDEDRLSPVHSVCVDQWDWEKVMGDGERSLSYLKATVQKIYDGLKVTEAAVNREFVLTPFLREDIHFILSETLLQRFPGMDAKQLVLAIAKKVGAVFLMGIG